MDEEENKPHEARSLEKIERGSKRNYPLINLDDSLKVVEIVKEMKGKAAKEDISQGINVKGGALLKRIASARRWGLIEGQGTMSITPLAMDILHPEKDEDITQAKLKAYFSVPIFKAIYETYGWNLPRKKLLTNILIRQGIQEKDAITLTNLIYLYKTIFSEEILEIEDNGDDENIIRAPGPKLFHGLKDFKKAMSGGKRLTENIFNLILMLGALREGINKLNKEEMTNKISTIEELVPDSHLIKSQVEILKSDISLLDEKNLKKIMPQRIEALIKTLMHHLEIQM